MYLPDVVNHALRVSPLLPGGMHFAHVEHGIHVVHSAICKDWRLFVSGIEIVGLYLIAPDAASTSALPQLSRGADCFFEEKGEPGLRSSAE